MPDSNTPKVLCSCELKKVGKSKVKIQGRSKSLGSKG
jgi:hypothetical protein